MTPNYCSDFAHGVGRRQFLKFAVGGTAGLAMAPDLSLWAQDTVARTRAKSVIILWMGGGPSQLDTFDPKPGHKNGGPVTALETPVRGFQVSQYLPKLATQAKNFSVIRTMNTGEGAHERGHFLMHTGYPPQGGIGIAPIGTVAAHELAKKEFPLPAFVSYNADVPLSSAFGEQCMPFVIRNTQEPIPNLHSQTGGDDEKRRAKLLEEQDASFEKEFSGREIDKRHDSAKKAYELMTTPLVKAFRLEGEKSELVQEYGPGFGQYCLMARRLAEAGVPAIEVGLGGWDTHDDNFTKVEKLCATLDRGMGTLIKDMAERDLLKDVLVVWMGEFGRTPEINGGNGRDHCPMGWSCVLAGGGIQGGRLVGDTGKSGQGMSGRVVTQADLFQTIYKALAIDPTKKYNMDGRYFNYVQGGGKVVNDLFG